jgi:DNA polymerase-1
MTKAFQVGEDIHTKTAVMLSGVDPAKMDKQEFKEFRKKAKPVNFGFLYGKWWKTFKQYAFQNYGVRFTDKESEEARNKYFNTYSGLMSWHKRQEKLVKKLGYVRYPDGTKRRLPDVYSTDKMVVKDAIKQAINSPVQGFASNICVLSAITLDKIIDWDECKMVMSVHDALMFDIAEDKKDKWLPIIEGVMNDPPIKETFGVDLNIPILAEGNVGRYWVE